MFYSKSNIARPVLIPKFSLAKTFVLNIKKIEYIENEIDC